MKRVINFLRGSVEVEASGPFPERFLNLCAQRGVSFWGVEWLDGNAVRLTVPRQERGGLEELGERTGCTVREVEREGLPAFLARFRRRYALMAGLGCSLLAVLLMTQFVLVVDVSGNQEVSTAAILTTLRRLGLRPGAFGPSIDIDRTEQEALLELKDLSWMAINRHGTRMEVLVRERVKPPKLEDDSQHGDVVAEAPGVITRLEVLSGETALKVGDPVAEGDVLISGNVLLEGPLYGDHDVGWRQVRARGRVQARTWRTLKAEIPLKACVKAYTGEEKQRWYLEWMGRRINFYRKSGISFPQYDKINETWRPERWAVPELPLCLGRETVREYTWTEEPVDRDAAEELLRTQLEQALREQVEPGSVEHMEYTAVVTEDLLKVTLRAECIEEIGRFVPFEGEAPAAD